MIAQYFFSLYTHSPKKNLAFQCYVRSRQNDRSILFSLRFSEKKSCTATPVGDRWISRDHRTEMVVVKARRVAGGHACLFFWSSHFIRNSGSRLCGYFCGLHKLRIFFSHFDAPSEGVGTMIQYFSVFAHLPRLFLSTRCSSEPHK